MRVALLGGTFDPPHVGHLIAASDAHDVLALDRLVFVPAAQQPLKQNLPVAAASHRLRMLQLMIQGDARFSLDEIEIQRTGLSFTVDTLEEYARRLPEAVRYFLIGADAFAMLDQWRDAPRVVALAHLVVLTRSGGGGGRRDLSADEVSERVRAIGGNEAAVPQALPARRIDVSSTEIRRRVAARRPIRGFVTDAVAQYIDTNELYR